MIYLLAGSWMWLVRAFLPAAIVLVAGLLIVRFAWRWQAVPGRHAMAAVVVVALAVLAWQTRAVRREFTHPEITMFRRYIADPIPDGVRNLERGSGAPLVFHEGAVVAFDASAEVLRALLDHTLPGSTALAALAAVKERNGRDTASVARVRAPEGAGYAEVDSTRLLPALEQAFPGAWARSRDALRAGLSVHVFAESGAWGRFESVVTYDAPRERVLVRQYVVRAPVQRD